MELYLFRHGIADPGKPGSPDSERQLTSEGRRKAAEVVKLAREAGVKPSLILSSPYARAVQTAEVAAEGLGYEERIILSAALVPHGTPQDVWAEIRDYRDEPAVLIAGHEPLLSQLTAWLLASPALHVDFRKATMVRIDFDTFGAVPHGTLRWMITASLAAVVSK